MPQLAALYDQEGEWDVYVVEGLVRGVLEPTRNTFDVLGDPLPDWAGARTINEIKPTDTQRLARQLKGLSRERRRAFFDERAQGASLSYSGTQA